MRRIALLPVLILLVATAWAAPPVLPKPTYDTILYFMHWWPEFASASNQRLQEEAVYLATKIGSGPYIKQGFQILMGVTPPDYSYPVNQTAINTRVQSIMSTVDSWIASAQAAGLLIEIHFMGSFYEWGNGAINTAVSQDPRVAQWYYTASGGDPQLAITQSGGSYWSTPSRYASNWREFKQKHFEALGAGFAERFYKYGNTLIAIDGDLEVRLSEDSVRGKYYALGTDLADYSPFAVAEFRDWLAHRGDYCDICASNPNAKYQRQGKSGAPSFENDATPAAFSAYYQVVPPYTDWQVEGYITPLKQIILGSFKAPFFSGTQWNFSPYPSSPPLLAAWLQFREFMVGNAVKETHQWMTSASYYPSGLAESGTPYNIPIDRIYASQIPGEHIGAGTPAYPLMRSFVFASGLKTGDTRPYGSPAWTGFNEIDGGTIYRSLDQEFYNGLQAMGIGLGSNWAITEFNPYVPANAPPPVYPLWPGLPCTNTIECFVSEITKVRQAGPHLLTPFSYEDITGGTAVWHVKSSYFTAALKTFIDQHKYTPRQYAPGTVFAPPIVNGFRGTHNAAGGVNLSWNANIFDGVSDFLWSEWPEMDFFNIYRSANPFESSAILDSPAESAIVHKNDAPATEEQHALPESVSLVSVLSKTSTSYRDVPTVLNQRYYYWINAVNKHSNIGTVSSTLVVDVCAQYGDLDANGSVTTEDADKALKLFLGLASPYTCSDVVGNVYKPGTTALTPRDALAILQKANNSSIVLPVP